MMYQSNTTKLYYVYYCIRQRDSILIESSSGPLKKTDPYLEMFKMRCEIPNAVSVTGFNNQYNQSRILNYKLVLAKFTSS